VPHHAGHCIGLREKYPAAGQRAQADRDAFVKQDAAHELRA
jgi:hypothetical protein